MSCFVTSYRWCKRIQLVDLFASAPPCARFEDGAPRINCTSDILVSCYVKGTGPNCADPCLLSAKLIARGGNVLATRNTGEVTCPSDGSWRRLELRFAPGEYPEGARHLEYTDGGKDAEHWAGHFGVGALTSTKYFYTPQIQGLKNTLANPRVRARTNIPSLSRIHTHAAKPISRLGSPTRELRYLLTRQGLASHLLCLQNQFAVPSLYAPPGVPVRVTSCSTAECALQGFRGTTHMVLTCRCA